VVVRCEWGSPTGGEGAKTVPFHCVRKGRALAGTKIVEAVSEVLVLRMPAARFSDLLMKRPDIVQHIQVVKRQQSVTGRLQAH